MQKKSRKIKLAKRTQPARKVLKGKNPKEIKFKKPGVKEVMAYQAWIKEKFEAVVKHCKIGFVKLEFTFINQDFANGHTAKVMAIDYLNRYHSAKIFIYPIVYNMYRNLKKKNIIDCIVHEVSHIHTNELTEKAMNRYIHEEDLVDANEKLTELLAQYVRENIVYSGNEKKIYG